MNYGWIVITLIIVSVISWEMGVFDSPKEVSLNQINECKDVCVQNNLSYCSTYIASDNVIICVCSESKLVDMPNYTLVTCPNSIKFKKNI